MYLIADIFALETAKMQRKKWIKYFRWETHHSRHGIRRRMGNGVEKWSSWKRSSIFGSEHECTALFWCIFLHSFFFFFLPCLFLYLWDVCINACWHMGKKVVPLTEKNCSLFEQNIQCYLCYLTSVLGSFLCVCASLDHKKTKKKKFCTIYIWPN